MTSTPSSPTGGPLDGSPPAGPATDGPGVFDPGLQSERTALAWERTAFALMTAGVLFARWAVTDAHPALAAGGLAQLLLGAGVLVWAGFRYQGMQGPLRADEPVVHPGAARLVGLATIVCSALALALAVAVLIDRH